MNGIIHIENFIQNPDQLFDLLTSTVKWDGRMTAPETASFGKDTRFNKYLKAYILKNYKQD